MIKLKDLENAVREIAATYPENVYVEHKHGCYYLRGQNSHHPKCGCLIGLGILQCDPSQTKTLESCEGMDIGSDAMYSQIIEDANPNNIQFLSNVQKNQDNGRTWGEAVMLADQSITGL